ncbi:MAG: hypothetical protein HY052_03730 [Proteobacteria bacterium]|nr:hypothetical protein [Pseudomonadota bacterium]
MAKPQERVDALARALKNKKPKGRSIEVAHDDIDFVSDRISEQTRYISFGVLAFVWLFLAGGHGTPTPPMPVDRNILLISGGFSLLSLSFDYFQYIFGYFNTCKEIDEAEAVEKDTVDFDYSRILHCLRGAMFWGKQLVMVVSLFFLLSAILATLKTGQAANCPKNLNMETIKGAMPD